MNQIDQSSLILPMHKMNTSTDESFEKLKSLLLKEEWETQDSIREDLRQIRAFLKDENFRSHVSPIIEEHLDELRKEFPKQYGEIIRNTVAKQVNESKDEMAEALYPIIGLMITKFISEETKKLIEGMEKRFKGNKFIKKITDFLRKWSQKFPSMHKVPILKNYIKKQEEVQSFKFSEIFVIQKGSGFVLASYSKTNNEVNKDMLAGMLTAIKAFSEDAIGKTSENLSTIEYNSFTILLSEFYGYYIATIVDGIITQHDKVQFKNKLLYFAKKNLSDIHKRNDQLSEQELSDALKLLISGQ